MQTIKQGEIKITARQLAGIGASVQNEVREAVSSMYERGVVDSTFYTALDEALARVGIALQFDDAGIGKGAAHTIVISNGERATRWRRFRQKPGGMR